MMLVLVGRERSIRSATGEGRSGSFFCVLVGRGIGGPPPVSASLYGLRPQTALRRTRDPSPSSVLAGRSRTPYARASWGGFCGEVGMSARAGQPDGSLAPRWE